MAQRFSIAGRRSPSAIRGSYDMAIASGVLITLFGIGFTVFSALADASASPYGHWLSGQVYF